MGKLKIANNLFLEKEELNKWENFNVLAFQNWIDENVEQFGIVNLASDTGFANLKIVAGTGPTLTVKAGMAIDSSNNIIDIPADLTNFIQATGGSGTYYIYIQYATNNNEAGTVQISNSSLLTGNGTSFTSVLRGQPNFPSVIRFTGGGDSGSPANTGDYAVVSVTDDATAVLSGVFVADGSVNPLTYGVVGTFSPGATVAGGDKMIFVYDGYVITVATSATVTAGVQFLLAKFHWDGTNVSEITDMRSAFLQLKADIALNYAVAANPLIGIEAVSYEPAAFKTVGDWYIATVGWGFRSVSASCTPGTSTILIASGYGGIINSTPFSTYFSAGQWNGWRCYFSDGTSQKITSSTLSGSSISIVLRQYPSTYPTDGLVTIVPDCDSIGITVISATNALRNVEQQFPVQRGFCNIRFRYQPLVTMAADILFTYRNIKNNQADTDYQPINNGTYTNEVSGTGTVSGGKISVLPNPDNYAIVGARLDIPNTFLDTQTLAEYHNTLSLSANSAIIWGTHCSVSGGVASLAGNIWRIDPTGSFYTIAGIAAVGQGSVVTLKVLNQTTFINSSTFVLPDGQNLTVGGNSSLTFRQQYNSGGTVIWEYIGGNINVTAWVSLPTSASGWTSSLSIRINRNKCEFSGALDWVPNATTSPTNLTPFAVPAIYYPLNSISCPMVLDAVLPIANNIEIVNSSGILSIFNRSGITYISSGMAPYALVFDSLSYPLY